jgi:hypothetical protein
LRQIWKAPSMWCIPPTKIMWLFMFMLPLDMSWPGWKYRKEEREGYYFILFLNKKDIRGLDSGYNGR